ncbi:putative secreted protein [Corynebacterium diphtheriae]|nr:putative secreted protein [Corynebacterium diphtheriae]
MKLFSRKGLVAATTAVAISAGSLSAPAMADTKPNDGSSFSQIIDVAGSTGASKTDKNKPKTDANKTIAQIKSVLNIISTVIAILGALFPLASQIMKKFGI